MSTAAPARAPFQPAVVVAVLSAALIALLLALWLVVRGVGNDAPDDGGTHVGGHGLNGYAALAALIEADGIPVAMARTPQPWRTPGLLVLTPPPEASGKDIAKIVAAHRPFGPVMVITPKWQAEPVNARAPGARSGWVNLVGTQSVVWRGFVDEASLAVRAMPGNGWSGRGPLADAAGVLPDEQHVQFGETDGDNASAMTPLIVSSGGHMLAATVDDTTGNAAPTPMVLVFEPDLLDNYGLARAENAMLADRMVTWLLATTPKGDADSPAPAVTFDLTLDGYAHPLDPMALALRPPWLAATLCLLLAGIAIAWRAFCRFGPPLPPEDGLMPGKQALVTSGASLVLRARRWTLLKAPYAQAVRMRIARGLSLPADTGEQGLDAAIDRALAARAPDALPFSARVGELDAARTPLQIVAAAGRLHAVERMLTR